MHRLFFQRHHLFWEGYRFLGSKAGWKMWSCKAGGKLQTSLNTDYVSGKVFSDISTWSGIWEIEVHKLGSIWHENMLGNLSVDIICFSKLTVFLELRSRKTVRFSEQIKSVDKIIISDHISTQNGYCLYIYSKVWLLFSNHRCENFLSNRQWLPFVWPEVFQSCQTIILKRCR